MSPARHACALAACLVFARPALAAVSAAPTDADLRRIDRVVAVVDEDPILESDVARVIGLGLVKKQGDESDAALRGRVLEQLIDERLRSHEIDRTGFIQVPVAQIEAQVAEIRARFPGEEAFAQRLASLGMDRAALAQLVARQLAVLAYVDERLGPRVYVSLEDIRTYYQDTLVPEMTAREEPPPPLDDVREEIRAVLREVRLNAELARFTEELRRDADVEVFDERDVATLPPLLETIGPAPKP